MRPARVVALQIGGFVLTPEVIGEWVARLAQCLQLLAALGDQLVFVLRLVSHREVIPSRP